ncbi:twin-arginine translocase TatA/TatE family subunit [Gleimia europaea]|uniref:Twin arginine-targeting protein translocase TatB n=1 Tax=Gleimia europaea ACS-120-V-Col10b TaxID=883069 RepID=A0A9W5REF1_9ACTO|nr:twin-arginine translocase TatA/TatE family subunit [Gleimia europaea]EPD30914.1 hypothetical protein HMPREF9238_00669 [Gleimia europaea ACS-120-V-Col10b]
MGFSISGSEFLVILVVIMLVVGPSRMPAVAKGVTRIVKSTRLQLTKWRASLDDQMGDDFKQVDLTKLDPRQYDPRRLIREAVQEEMDEWKKLMNPLAPLPPSSKPSAAHFGGEGKTSAQTPVKSEASQSPAVPAPVVPVKPRKIRVSSSPTMKTRAKTLKRGK